MINEVAILTINLAQVAGFEATAIQARPLFLAAEGCRSMRIDRVIEEPRVYHLNVEWETIAHHTDIFRSSAAFQDWRALIAPFLSVPPSVVHTETL